MSGVAVSNGVVYLSALNGDLYALDDRLDHLRPELVRREPSWRSTSGTDLS